MFNFGNEDFKTKMGDKIYQLIFEKIKTPEVVEVDSLEETGRGEKCFGSTGIKSEEQKINSQSPDQDSETDQLSEPKTVQISSAIQSTDSVQNGRRMKQFKSQPIQHTITRSQASRMRHMITARQLQKLAKQG